MNKYNILLPHPLNHDIIKYIYSFLKNYSPILRLINKDWKNHFPVYPNESISLLDEIINNNDTNTLNYIYRFGKPWRDIICIRSSQKQSLEILKWSKLNGIGLDTSICYRAAIKGARENNCPWNSNICSDAARYGHFELLKWSILNGCPYDTYTCSCAAYGGYLEILKWLRENNCPWDEDTCTCATMKGHFEVLKWARANGCPWNKFTFIYASVKGNFEILKWVKANGCPCD